jgi:hypothetical protein
MMFQLRSWVRNVGNSPIALWYDEFVVRIDQSSDVDGEHRKLTHFGEAPACREVL